MKIWTRPTTRVDLGLGFGLGDFACSDRFNPCGQRSSFNADYLWQGGHSSYDALSLHLGLGARFWFWNYGNNTGDFQVAARVPIGLDLYIFKWLEGYGEIAPSLALVGTRSSSWRARSVRACTCEDNELGTMNYGESPLRSHLNARTGAMTDCSSAAGSRSSWCWWR